MAKDFRTLTPTTQTPATSGSAAPAAAAAAVSGSWWRRQPKWLVFGGAALVVVVVLAVIGIVTTSGSGSSSPSSEAIRTAHGPSTLESGVPRGYTRDEDGARTAAVNFIQAVDQVEQGRLDGNTLRRLAVASDPSTALTSVLASATGQPEIKGRVFADSPLLVTVSNFSPDQATVSDWSIAAAQSPTGGSDAQVGVLATYATTDVTLVWQDGDWKAKDWNFHTGPTADQAQFPAAGSPLSKPGGNGLYSFYVN